MTAAEWDSATWTLTRVLRNHDGAVSAVSALADGRILTASLDGKLKVWHAMGVAPVRVQAKSPRQEAGKEKKENGGGAGKGAAGAMGREMVTKGR